MLTSTRAAALVLAVFLLPSAGLSQSFEVASVKRHDPADRTFGPPACVGNRFDYHGLPISELLAWAYDLRQDEFRTIESALPAWARTDFYDIAASAAQPIAEPQCKPMVQRLLEDRFRLKTSRKTASNAQTNELRVSAKGHKLKPVRPEDTGCGVHISYQGQERPCDRYQTPFAPKRAMTMPEFARILTLYKSREPATDATGLTGEYKINLSFALRTDDPQYPSLETALREQLGLELHPVKGELSSMVVESIQRPTDN